MELSSASPQQSLVELLDLCFGSYSNRKGLVRAVARSCPSLDLSEENAGVRFGRGVGFARIAVVKLIIRDER
jgi:hypothetical protein